MSDLQSVAEIIAELREKQRSKKEERDRKDWLWRNDYITRSLDARDREDKDSEKR